MLLSCSILVISYLFIFSEKMNRAVAAMLGAAAMIFFGVLTQEQAIHGIDFNTLFLLIGMMIIVGISAKSGMFQFLAVWAAKKVKVSPRGLLIALAVITAILSMFLDNVTTVLLIVPITFQITKQLKINPYPYLILQIFASNIGGTATLIGDPPNILIGSSVGLSFMDFMYSLTPIVVVTMLVVLIIFDFAFGRKIKASKRDRVAVMKMDERRLIKNSALLKKSLVILALVIAGFISAEHIGIANGSIALTGSAVLLLLYSFGIEHDKREKLVEETFDMVDWTTIFFFAGLFVIVYGLETTGILGIIGQEFINLTKGDIAKTAMLVMWSSAFVSSAIDNIPFVATMIPMLKSMEEAAGGREVFVPVWWSLSLGACFGGNGTLIGASANVIVAGMASREGHPINFLKFMIWGMPVMILTVAIATVGIWLKYFM